MARPKHWGELIDEGVRDFESELADNRRRQHPFHALAGADLCLDCGAPIDAAVKVKLRHTRSSRSVMVQPIHCGEPVIVHPRRRSTIPT